MSDLANQILKSLSKEQDHKFAYSSNPDQKHLEIKAFEELEASGKIIVELKTIGYVISRAV